MNVIASPIAGLKIIERQPIQDRRGSFTRMFCKETLAQHGINTEINQINLSQTKLRGTVRGLHYQHPPFAETKIVSCIHGTVFDIAIDLRHGSPTFLQWHAELLSGENCKAMAIPPGFAHGFQTLEDDCTLLYLHSQAYCSAHEDGLRFDDPRIAIAWPLPVNNLSDRDQSFHLLGSLYEGIQL